MNEDFGHPIRFIRSVLLVLVILVIVGVAFSVIFPFMAPFRSGYYPFYHPFFPFGLLVGLFLLFIFFGAFRWVFWPWGWGWRYRRRYWMGRDQSYYILRERYAKGEITKEQYDKMMQDLQKMP